MLFFWLKIFINFKKWVYKEMVKSFLLGILRGCPKALQNTLLMQCVVCKYLVL